MDTGCCLIRLLHFLCKWSLPILQDNESGHSCSSNLLFLSHGQLAIKLLISLRKSFITTSATTLVALLLFVPCLLTIDSLTSCCPHHGWAASISAATPLFHKPLPLFHYYYFPLICLFLIEYVKICLIFKANKYISLDLPLPLSMSWSGPSVNE